MSTPEKLRTHQAPSITPSAPPEPHPLPAARIGAQPGAQPGAPPTPPTTPPPAPAVQPTGRQPRWRLAAATLALTALLGGGAGAAVATVIADGTTTTVSPTSQSITVSHAATATEVTAAAAKASPSVVTISATAGGSGGTGSGVIMTGDGYVVTNDHVVTLGSTPPNAQIQVRTDDGTIYSASVVGTDPTSDIAVIKLEGASGLTPAVFADSDKLQVGDVAVAIGAPLGLSGTVTDGIVSAVHRAVTTGSAQTQGQNTVIDAIQTDAAINPGNSGGPLVSATGEVIGINSAIASVAQNAANQGGQSGNIGIGFAIPANTATDIAKQLIADGTADHGYLAASVSASGTGTGALLREVSAGGPAAAAGLRAGDVVTGIDDRLVEASDDLVAAVRTEDPGAEVTLTYTRDGKSGQATVSLGTAPAATG